MKKLEVTFNDDTKQEDIDALADMLRQILEQVNVTAVIIVSDEPIPNEQTPLRQLLH